MFYILKGSSFKAEQSNFFESSSVNEGGVLSSIDFITISFSGCYFENVYSYSFGGFLFLKTWSYINLGTLTIQDCRFTNVTADQDGGLIYVLGTNFIEINNVEITKSYSINAGCFHVISVKTFELQNIIIRGYQQYKYDKLNQFK